MQDRPALRPVLLAHDGAPSSEPAEAWAAWLGSELGLGVHVLVAAGDDGADHRLFAKGVGDAQRLAAGAGDRLAQAGCDVTVQAAHGRPGPALVQACAKLAPGVLVLGSHDAARLGYGAGGSVLGHVKNRVASSVLVARRAPGDLVAVGTDGSEGSRAAEAVARAWAARLGAPVRRLVAADHPDRTAGPDAETVEGDAAAWLAAWSRRHPAALLVLGARGRTGGDVLHLGSVSDRVALGAACSVLVVRPGTLSPADDGGMRRPWWRRWVGR